MAEQYIPYTFNQIPSRLDPSSGPITMIEVQFTDPKVAEVRHWTCGICGRAFPETEMSQVGGGWYCIKFKHDQDKSAQMNRKPVVSLT